jgi:hypothetical protein
VPPDLFSSPELEITPVPGRIGPRFWIKRLVVWAAPGGRIIRDISLRPGLNIIWSPDGADSSSGQTGDIGHGSGKTLLCRLIRYCLGENNFATRDVQHRIGAAFMNALVGAEIMLDGETWAVVRPLGVRRRHMAVQGGNLDEIAATEGGGTGTGIEPLLQAIDDRIIGQDAKSLVLGAKSSGYVWPVALAFLSRDQECRFDHVLDWRSASSDSGSPLPASGATKGPRLEALRVFLQAITRTEYDQRIKLDELENERSKIAQEIESRRWQLDRDLRALIASFALKREDLPDLPLLIDTLKKGADTQYAKAASLPPDKSANDLATARAEHKQANADVSRLTAELKSLQDVIPVHKRNLALIEGELPGLSGENYRAENPVCPICSVPISRALAEGCGLSDKLPDIEACKARFVQKQKDETEQRALIKSLEAKEPQLKYDLETARQSAERLQSRVNAFEKASSDRNQLFLAATLGKDKVGVFSELYSDQQKYNERLFALDKEITAARDELARLRADQANVFGDIGKKYDPIIRRLIGDQGSGRIQLSASAIDLIVDMGGDRKTAAIESLKILAFDLAVMCRSMESKTNLPDFIIHDSPREADLGLSIYHELFRMIAELEAWSDTPLFQYILTTTTRPPDDFLTRPFMCLTLNGAPASRRLLGTDL